MSKDKVTDWSTDPNENRDIGGTPLIGNQMYPSQVPVAIRKLMAQLRAANDNTRRRSRALNGAFQLSQENGNQSGSTPGYRPADGWHYRALAAGESTIQRVQVRSLSGSTDQLEHKTVTAKPVLAANDNCAITTAIEGFNLADFAWGTPRAKAMLVDFEISAPLGTYTLHISNGAGNRHYAAPVTILANEAGTPVRKTMRIPGDVSGAWDTGSGIGAILDLTLAAGSTLQGEGGAWTQNAVAAVPTQRNILDATGNTVRLADFAVYVADGEETSAPAFETPAISETERTCFRYYWKVSGGAFVPIANGSFFNSASWTGVFTFPVTMRTVPQVAVSAQNAFEVAGTAVLPTTAMGIANPGNQTIRVQATVSGATAGQGAFLRCGSSGGWISFHARLLG